MVHSRKNKLFPIEEIKSGSDVIGGFELAWALSETLPLGIDGRLARSTASQKSDTNLLDALEYIGRKSEHLPVLKTVRARSNTAEVYRFVALQSLVKIYAADHRSQRIIRLSMRYILSLRNFRRTSST